VYRVNLDAGKFSFGNRVCDDSNRLPVWVVSGESVNEFNVNENNAIAIVFKILNIV